jgi:hypothetical protein
MTRFLVILLIVSLWAAIWANFALADNGALATCEARNMELTDLNAQLGAIAESFRSQLEARKVQVVRITPVAGKPGRCAGKTVKTEQCKRGRTLNRNCRCGVW